MVTAWGVKVGSKVKDGFLPWKIRSWSKRNTAPRDDQGQAQQRAQALQKTSAEYKGFF